MTPPPTGGHAFLPIRTIFELNCHIQKTHTENVTSRVFSLYTYRENCPAPWRTCFSPIWTIFKLVQEINKINVLTNFHDDWAKTVTSKVFTRKTSPPTGDHVFQHTGTTFELNQDII
ncbi:hypothetical protein DPMN_178373 [Dreissena polymorpha]|uniref:Uncharacterized protein n=1 Tax=Dreissena polymorpha TaxID=45954 RepID=A0A9D4ED94_DREPO|nr:hypothetical protein DPMN_178373 [Dreissena polymorpha]